MEVLSEYYSIDDLPLTEEQKMMVLVWFARKLWILIEEGSGDPEYYCKSYDPLSFWDGKAHSYVFDLEDGGRHHEYGSLEHLENMLMSEGINEIKKNGFLNEKDEV